MYIGQTTIKGDSLSAYDRDTWKLNIYYDTASKEIYTEDELGDYDTIGEADTLKEAIEYIKNY